MAAMTSLRSTPASASNKSTASSTAKPTAESTSGRLEIAEKLLLAPFGLTQAHLSRALGEITSHGADDADLYFQYTRSEGWSLEEGIVKTGSFSIDQGVGVRAVSGEKTAFAYSDDISEASLLDAARTVRSISAGGKSPA
jgi:TldD protein